MQDITSGALTALEDASGAIGALIVQYALSTAGAVIILVIGFIAAGLLARWTYSASGRVRGLDETLRRFLSKLVRYSVLILVGVTVLAQFGVQTASIIAALGAAGLAIGLALQGTLQNIAAGIMLLVLRPFRIGEYAEAGGIAGTIEEIGLFATQLKTLDGLFVLAPNSSLWGSAVTNFSRNPMRRHDLAIGIGYDDDIGKAMDIYRSLIEADERVLTNPEPYYFVSSLGDSAVEVTARYWVKTPEWWMTTRDLTRAAKQRFDEEGLSIPFPQRDVHLIGQEKAE
ncbi:MAG: mechanosensitive ion channel [Brucellaceae bacterium]|nr:mechanosensitive ion channel [Brucellaceae bacterium]